MKLICIPLLLLLLGAMPNVAILSDPATPIAVVTLSVPAGLDRQTNRENGLAAFTAYALLESPVAAHQPLTDAIAEAGGSIDVQIHATASVFTITALPDRLDAVLALLQTALAHPDFSATTVDRTRAELLSRFVASQQDSVLVGVEMINGVEATSNLFAATPLGLPATIVALRGSSAERFFAQNYRQAGTTFALTAPFATDRDIVGLQYALQSGKPSPMTRAMQPLMGASRELHATRAGAPAAYVLSFPAPKLSDPSAPAAFVLAQMLRTSIVSLSELPDIPSRLLADSAIDVSYDYMHMPARYLVRIDGTLGNASRIVGVTLGLAHALSAVNYHGDIGRFVDEARGNLAIEMRTPTSRVQHVAQFLATGFPSNEATLLDAKIAHVNTAELALAARGLSTAPTIAIVGSSENN